MPVEKETWPNNFDCISLENEIIILFYPHSPLELMHFIYYYKLNNIILQIITPKQIELFRELFKNYFNSL